jgi:hypothetical protein
MTKVNNVFVCGYSEVKLQECTTHGSLMREVDLKSSGISNPLFAIALDKNHFVYSALICARNGYPGTRINTPYPGILVFVPG